MTDPFMMKGTPWYTWPKVGSILLFAGITVLLLRWPSSGPVDGRVQWFVFFSALAGVATIWFPDSHENYENLSRESLVDKVKPLKYECSVGWLLLLGPFVVWLVMKLI